MALFLVLGFGMDYAIFTRELRQHREVTLQAILLSALTSLLSFGLLSTSTIPVVASFGTTLLVGNLFNLFGAFVYARIQSE
jgi:predicted exporter